MWTAENRSRTARIAEKTKRHPSDLTDEEQAAVEPLLTHGWPGRAGAAAPIFGAR